MIMNMGKMMDTYYNTNFYHKAQYHDPKVGTSKRKPIPMKTLFYLPIIPRFQRLFAPMQTAGQMT